MRSKDDERLRHRLENKLSNQGLRAPCRLTVEVYQRMATLTGKVLYDYQKRAAIQSARTMDGMNGVIDRIKVEPPTKNWETEPHTPSKPSSESMEPMQGPASASDEVSE